VKRCFRPTGPWVRSEPASPWPSGWACSTAIATLRDPSHPQRLAESYHQARANPLWQPLERVLDEQLASTRLGGSAADSSSGRDPALRDYILLITILVAFLEATAHQLRQIQPPVVIGFSGINRIEGSDTTS